MGSAGRYGLSAPIWTDSNSHSILNMELIGTPRSSVENKLERLAKLAVPAFGL
jgi:hypothetical protein